MKNGACDTSTSSYSYDQWTNCECTGTIGASKKPTTTKCTVDHPNSLCQQITEYSACTTTTAPTTAANSAAKHQISFVMIVAIVTLFFMK